mmetsp:Transcript_36075/g.75017  ORF Transcript_36075/g.75017 Transcript_36075/m.75017 type:complete len:216 (+) Transcript_36075:290-937(+)
MLVHSEDTRTCGFRVVPFVPFAPFRIVHRSFQFRNDIQDKYICVTTNPRHTSSERRDCRANAPLQCHQSIDQSTHCNTPLSPCALLVDGARPGHGATRRWHSRQPVVQLLLVVGVHRWVLLDRSDGMEHVCSSRKKTRGDEWLSVAVAPIVQRIDFDGCCWPKSDWQSQHALLAPYLQRQHSRRTKPLARLIGLIFVWFLEAPWFVSLLSICVWN